MVLLTSTSVLLYFKAFAMILDVAPMEVILHKALQVLQEPLETKPVKSKVPQNET